jgi:hypothetical protein
MGEEGETVMGCSAAEFKKMRETQTGDEVREYLNNVSLFE